MQQETGRAEVLSSDQEVRLRAQPSVTMGKWGCSSEREGERAWGHEDLLKLRKEMQGPSQTRASPSRWARASLWHLPAGSVFMI